MDNQAPIAARILSSVPLHSILQRLPGIVYILALCYCFFAPIYTPIFYSGYYIFVHFAFLYAAIRLFVGSITAFVKSKNHTRTDWIELLKSTPFANQVRHFIIIPQYKEEVSTMHETLDVLASHQLADNYHIVLAMEQGEEEAPKKAQALIERYKAKFANVIFTLHPKDIPMELRGKGSNVAWAAKELLELNGGPRETDLMTIMDADTCFASDYFESLSYHYGKLSNVDRKLAFFSAGIVFDRNSDKVPFLVRAFDMIWSQGTASYFCAISPSFIATSAYSISTQLAYDVGLWDTRAFAIGEDWHMYLKCLLSTNGDLVTIPIFSPASQSNIEGKGGFISGIYAKYVQAKRHFWAALDVGYVIRRLLFGLFAPGWDAPYNSLVKIPISNAKVRKWWKLLFKGLGAFYSCMEEYFFLSQTILIIATSSVIIPPGMVASVANAYWNLFSNQPVHPTLIDVLNFGTNLRWAVVVVFVLGVVFYEYFLDWVGTKRWQIPNHKLGKRSKLQFRREWYHTLDWFSFPIYAVYYVVLTTIQTQIMQLFTENLVYVVSAKPVIEEISDEDSDITQNGPKKNQGPLVIVELK